MTPRTLFTIIVKIVGLYLVFNSLIVISQFITSTATVFTVNRMGNIQDTILEALFLLVALGLYALVFWLCLFKTDYVIDKLALDKHFTEEKFEINIHRSTVLSIAVIVTGAFLFIDALPGFCREVLNYVGRMPLALRFGENTTTFWVIYYAIKLLIGYILMSQQRFIVNLIERQRKK